MRVKIITFFIIGLLLSGFVYGGGSSQNVSPAVQSAATSAGGADAFFAVQAEPLTLPITKDNITLRIFCEIPDRAAATLKNFNEMVAYQELQKRTGIKLEFIHAPTPSLTEQFNLMIASGDLPELIFYPWNLIPGGPDKAMDDGIIQNIRDPIAKYAPNFKQILKDNPNVYKDTITDNGRIYWVPQLKMYKEDRTVGGFMIRQDWLDKLGLKVPTTMDEWYTVLKAFKEKDPNGTGKPVIPMISMKTNDIDGIERFTYAWGFPADFYDDNGTVKYGPVQPGYKEFLKTMAKWYAEGLIDPEYLATDRRSHDAKVTSGEAGSFYGLINSFMGTYTANMAKIDPKFNLVSVPLPMSSDGKRYDFYPDSVREVCNAGFAFSTKNKYVKESVKMLDYYFTEDGKVLMNLGIEGLTFNIVNGEYLYTDLITNNPNGWSRDQAIAHYTPSGVTARLFQDKRYWLQMAVYPNQIAGMAIFADATSERAMPMISIQGDDATTLAGIQNELRTYQREMQAKFIMGQLDIDSQWDTFVKTLDSLRLSNAIDILQQAVTRYDNRK